MKTLYCDVTHQSFIIKGEFLAIKFIDLHKLDYENKIEFNQEYINWYREFLESDKVILNEQRMLFLETIEDLSYECI